MTAPVTLLAFAVLVATLGPRLLMRSGWPERSPRLGILAWQAMSGSLVLAVVLAGAVLALPAVPFSANLAELLSACVAALRAHYATPGGAALSASGAVLALGVLARAGYCLAVGLVSAGRERRRQLQALALVARRHQTCDALVVESTAAAAYCLPGRRREVVLTTGALAALDDDQLAGVLAHERAHLRGRHDVVLAASAALQQAFPRVPAFRVAHGELARLVEMLADDVAVRGNDRLTVATVWFDLPRPRLLPRHSVSAGRRPWPACADSRHPHTRWARLARRSRRWPPSPYSPPRLRSPPLLPWWPRRQICARSTSPRVRVRE